MTATAAGTDVAALGGAMTLEQKLAQLVGVWAGFRAPDETDHGNVAPFQDELRDADLDGSSRHGLGQITRSYGTRPVDAAANREFLAAAQRRIAARSGHGIRAVVHEECLTGLMALGATAFPSPPAWGATWHPELVREMAAAIGETMAALDVHQGLAPVLDVVRDPRWGRVEECIAEDPLLVGVLGTEYVRGLQSHGVVATCKHFAGYSASGGGRNMAPVHIGSRELRDVFLPPFEMAVRDGGARSVMHSYTDVDGVPCVADESLLTGILRAEWGFTGTVVADYSGIRLLVTMHRTARDLGEAAVQALRAGVDVELPTGEAYLEPLAAAVRDGEVPETLIDRALERVLRQKAELGLIGEPPERPEPAIDLDPPAHRAIAVRLAEESVILLHNRATLPLVDPPTVAVIGPNADNPLGLLGGYSFPNHVGSRHPGTPLGIAVPTVLDALRVEFARSEVRFAPGCGIADGDRGAIADAVATAAAADVCVAVLGDRPGLFGRGTVGEGCDAEDLDLPGVQRELLAAVLDTGTPVVVVLVSGRPYAIGWAVPRAAAVVQAFLPGAEGAAAVAGVLSGRINPSGRLPMSMPRSVGAQPYTYLHPPLGGPTPVSESDPTPAFPFGHGLSFGTVTYGPLDGPPAEVALDDAVRFSVEVANTADRACAEIVQVYVTDVVASVTRPDRQLVGWCRVELPARAAARAHFEVPTDLFSFTDRSGHRIVEPGDMRLLVGRSSADIVADAPFLLTGAPRRLGPDRRMRSSSWSAPSRSEST